MAERKNPTRIPRSKCSKILLYFLFVLALTVTYYSLYQKTLDLINIQQENDSLENYQDELKYMINQTNEKNQALKLLNYQTSIGVNDCGFFQKIKKTIREQLQQNDSEIDRYAKKACRILQR